MAIRKRRAIYWLMYGAGLRPGEAYNLTTGWIDLDSRIVRIENRAATEDAPPFIVKCDAQSAAGKSRTVPFPEAAWPDVIAAAKLAFRSGGFIALMPERFLRVQEYWGLCRAGKPWAGRAIVRPNGGSDVRHVVRAAWPGSVSSLRETPGGSFGPISARSGPMESHVSPYGIRLGATGFEPATSCSQSRCATGLRHAPRGRQGTRFTRHLARGRPRAKAQAEQGRRRCLR